MCIQTDLNRLLLCSRILNILGQMNNMLSPWTDFPHIWYFSYLIGEEFEIVLNDKITQYS
jgi:hypothetical protein